MAKKLLKLGFGTEERNEVARLRFIIRLVTIMTCALVLLLPVWMLHYTNYAFFAMNLRVKITEHPAHKDGSEDGLGLTIKKVSCKVDMNGKYMGFECDKKAFKKLARQPIYQDDGHTCHWEAKAQHNHELFHVSGAAHVVEKDYEQNACQDDLVNLLSYKNSKYNGMVTAFLYLIIFMTSLHSLSKAVKYYDRPNEKELNHLLVVDGVVFFMSLVSAYLLLSYLRSSPWGRIPSDSHVLHFQQTLHMVIAYLFIGCNLIGQGCTTYGSYTVLEFEKTREFILTDKEREALQHVTIELQPYMGDKTKKTGNEAGFAKDMILSTSSSSNSSSSSSSSNRKQKPAKAKELRKRTLSDEELASPTRPPAMGIEVLEEDDDQFSRPPDSMKAAVPENDELLAEVTGGIGRMNMQTLGHEDELLAEVTTPDLLAEVINVGPDAKAPMSMDWR